MQAKKKIQGKCKLSVNLSNCIVPLSLKKTLYFIWTLQMSYLWEWMNLCR